MLRKCNNKMAQRGMRGVLTIGLLLLGARQVMGQLTTTPDERLTLPRNYIAADSGDFNNVKQPELWFDRTAGTDGNYYTTWGGLGFLGGETSRLKVWHTQHVVRLPNKDGRAYFMVSQSYAKGGWISLLQTDLARDGVPAIDENDLVTTGGHYIWQDRYVAGNPVGNWNHPGKMELVGGLLLVAAQNWTTIGVQFSEDFASLRGDSEDAVLFYDVRDPEHPRYWGKLGATDLGIQPTDAGGYTQREISVVGLCRDSAGNYILNAGGEHFYRTYKARTVSPDIRNWTAIDNGGGDTPITGQHGMLFDSYQGAAGPADVGVDTTQFLGDGANQWNGLVAAADEWRAQRKTVGFLLDPEHDEVVFGEVALNGAPPVAAVRKSLHCPGSPDHYDTDSIYVTAKGMPIVYHMEAAQHDNLQGCVFQLHGPANVSLKTPTYWGIVTNTNDSGPGSLREAAGSGGVILFGPEVYGKTIQLTSGPIIGYLHDIMLRCPNQPVTIVGQPGPGPSIIFVTTGGRQFYSIGGSHPGPVHDLEALSNILGANGVECRCRLTQGNNMFCVSQPSAGNVVSQTPLSKPQMPNAANNVDGRMTWTHSNGQFADAGRGIWVETNKTNTDKAEFKEVKRTADFIEFADARRPMFVRVFATNAIWSSNGGDNGQWNPLYNGSWKNRVGLPAVVAPAQDIVSGILGSSWTYNYGGTEYPFVFGAGTVNNFQQWTGVTWQRVAANQIRLVYPDQRTMTMTFDSPRSFRGTDFDGQTEISGRRTSASVERPNPIAPPAVSPTTQIPAKPADPRKTWAHKNGRFTNASPGVWVESNNTNSDTAQFKEVRRAVDFVEFSDAARPIFIRVFATNCFWSQTGGDNGEWNLLYQGSWKKDGSGNGSDDTAQVWTGKFRSYKTALRGKLVIGVGKTQDPFAVDVDDDLMVAVVVAGDETRTMAAKDAFTNLEFGTDVTVKSSQGKVVSITIMRR